MISVTAIQEAQQSAVAAFEDFMDSCMDSEWQQVGAALHRAHHPAPSLSGRLCCPSGSPQPFAGR